MKDSVGICASFGGTILDLMTDHLFGGMMDKRNLCFMSHYLF